MDSLSKTILSVFHPFSELFSKPSWKKALILLFGTLLCIGKRTVCSALRIMGYDQESVFSKYHHLLNRTEWSLLKAAKILFFMLLKLIPDHNPLIIFVDETLERRKGKKIKPKGYYRDAVRSSQTKVVKTMGLKWSIMALSIKLPFLIRTLALPFLSVLEPSKKCNEERKRRHKTSLKWTSQMILQVRRWVGKTRSLTLVGDGGYAAGQLAIDCICSGTTLVSRLKMNAALFDFPAEKFPGQRGRSAKKGVKLKNFNQMLSLIGLPWKEMMVNGYGGEKRMARVISNTCLWGADGTTPIPIRWTLVVDPLGKLDPLPLMSTDPLMTPQRMVELFINRWSIEVTFEETREHLGVETQRQWSDKAIARSTPILMGLYSCVCLMANLFAKVDLLKVAKTSWHQKEYVTFSDMLRSVRMVIWKDNLISGKAKITSSVENITPEMMDWIDNIVKRVLQAA